MKPAPETEKKFRDFTETLESAEVEEIRRFARFHPTRFIPLVRQILSRVRKAPDVARLTFLLENFPKEMEDIAPFVKKHLNRAFLVMEKLHFYREIAGSAWILEHCGDVHMLDLVSGLLESPQVLRYLPSVDVYRYKRARHLMSRRFTKAGDVATAIELELEKPDIRWVEEAGEDGRAL